MAHFREGRYAEAALVFAELVRCTPGSAAAYNNLATALGLLGRMDEAIASYEHALTIDPTDLGAHLNAMNLTERHGTAQDAIDRARVLLRQFPDVAIVAFQAGRIFYAQGLRDESRQALARALTLDPDFVVARWLLAMVELPQAYGPNEDPELFRIRFATAIDELGAWFDDARSARGYQAVGETQPFYLAFHESDHVALLSRYGDLCERLMRASVTVPPSAARHRTRHKPIRVAVVSAHLHDQSVWTALVRGWCTHHDRERVAFHLFHTGTTVDAETAIARAEATSFHIGLPDVFEWAAAIANLEPDVILYPELGMDPMCAKLAALRLAPVQMASWGHPQTSGLPTIDYFISGAAFEPPGSQAHYREKLVSLPNLGCYYDVLDPPFAEPAWASLGLDRDVPRLICAGTPYKYMPQHDHLLVEIAHRLGECNFLFFVDKAPLLSRQVEARIALAFREAGLDARRYVKFLPRQSRPAFFGLMRAADVYLDTLGFSGFNTAMQAIECELPVVTCEGRFMRGRLASGILQTMGMDELVAPHADAYVELGVRLCRDAKYRLDVGSRLATKSGVLFRDLAPVRALEDLLEQVCAAPAGAAR